MHNAVVCVGDWKTWPNQEWTGLQHYQPHQRGESQCVTRKSRLWYKTEIAKLSFVLVALGINGDARFSFLNKFFILFIIPWIYHKHVFFFRIRGLFVHLSVECFRIFAEYTSSIVTATLLWWARLCISERNGRNSCNRLNVFALRRRYIER